MVEGSDIGWTEVLEVTKQRLQGAMASYVVLALMALAVLRGRVLAVVLVLLVGLAAKSWIVHKKEQL